MFKRFKLWWLFATIEFHWLFIKHERKLGTRKINEGVEVTSPQMLLLSNHLNTHILRAETARKKYESLTQLSAADFQPPVETKQQFESAICNNNNNETEDIYILKNWVTQAFSHHM